MKFVTDSTTLSEKLSYTQGISERKATMPVLSHVLLETISGEKDSFHITATDLETTIKSTCPATIMSPGSIAVPARKLFEIIKELPPGEVEVEEINNHWVEIRTKDIDFKIAGLPGEDFPKVTDPDNVEMFSIKSDILEDLIGKTIFAVTPDDLRKSLAGIYFESIPSGALRLVATDSHRLSLSESSESGDISLEQGVLVPKKGVAELRKLLKSSDTVNIGFTNNEFVADADGIALLVRLIKADFPDYTLVIPESTKIVFTANRERLVSAIRRVALMSSEKTRSIKLLLESGKLTLSAVSPELGEATEVLGVDYEGEQIEVGFNSLYLMEAVEAAESENIVIGVTDELSPAVVKPADEKGYIEGYIGVVMPMRI